MYLSDEYMPVCRVLNSYVSNKSVVHTCLVQFVNYLNSYKTNLIVVQKTGQTHVFLQSKQTNSKTLNTIRDNYRLTIIAQTVAITTQATIDWSCLREIIGVSECLTLLITKTCYTVSFNFSKRLFTDLLVQWKCRCEHGCTGH